MRRIADVLAGCRTLGLDTGPIIYFIEANPRYDQRMTAVVAAISSGDVDAVTSVITLTEVLVQPKRTGDLQLQDTYHRFLEHSAHLTMHTVTSAVADRAADLRARYGIRTPDALQLATALEYGCEAFLTNDRQLARVSELSVLVLDDLQP